MNRQILIPITGPVVVVGGLLCVTCLASAWYIQRLEATQARVLSENVQSLRAAQDLEIVLRQLRFHSFIYLADPLPERLDKIDEDHERFDAKIREAQELAQTNEERAVVQRIRNGFRQYRDEMQQLRQAVSPGKPLPSFGRLADSHPIQKAVQPCEDLVRLNEEELKASSRDNDQVGKQARTVMLIIGVLGPLSGLAFGLGIARMLSRSIFQLSVRIQDIANRLDQDVGSVAIVADGNIDGLERQLQYVLERVEEVTARIQQHQREMLRTEQLASVGQLAASVAHEVRNPLTAVKMLVEMAVRPRDPKPITPNDLRVIHSEITRLERTVQGFLDFARLPTPQRAECDLRRAVDQAVDLLKGRAQQQKVEIVTRCPESPVIAHVDSDQLRTVLVNLGINALDAMPQGGRLQLVLSAIPNGVQLSISDTGAGIAPEIAERLFMPFASTKQTGTGLGLSISRRIVEEHGGTISATNLPEGGARFTIHLPGAQIVPTPMAVAKAG